MNRLAARSASVAAAMPDLPSPLQLYVGEGDPQAFARILADHGPMVLGVCRRILRRSQDAEDACQATFLVLARSAPALRDETRLAAWLHRVATRCAWRLHRESAERQQHEISLDCGVEPASEPAPDSTWQETLDTELSRLPERYRLPLLLCYFEGQSCADTATQLGLTRAGVKTRLERGRALLRKRLVHRGITTAGVTAALHFVHSSAVASIAPAAKTSASALVLSQSVQRQYQLMSAFARFLPLAASITLIATFATGERTAAQPPAAPIGLDNPASIQPVADVRSAEIEYPFVLTWAPTRQTFAPGDEITIQEIRGTKTTFGPGGRYLVRGFYRLGAGAQAKLYFGLSASGADGYTSGEEASQSVILPKGEGKFSVSRFFQSPGEPHLSLYADRGPAFGSISFADPQAAPREETEVSTDLPVSDRGFDGPVAQLKFRADKGDLTAAAELAVLYARATPPNLIQAYRWLRVASDREGVAELKKTLTPEQLAEAERLALAYINRPSAPPSASR